MLQNADGGFSPYTSDWSWTYSTNYATELLQTLQTIPGTLTGTVLSSEGDPVPGASITLTDAKGKKAGTATSGDDGVYTVTLPQGAYSLECAAAGNPPKAGTVTLPAGDTLPLDVPLPKPGTAPTTTTLKAAPASVEYGTGVTFTVTVKPVAGSAPLKGAVLLQAGGETLTTISLSDNKAKGAVTRAVKLTPDIGVLSVTAVYSGDVVYEGSESAAATVTVTKLATTVTGKPDKTSIKLGATVKVAASLTAKKYPVQVTGDVVLEVNAGAGWVEVGRVAVTPKLGKVDASFSYVPATKGTIQLRVCYLGDAYYAASRSTPVSVKVT
jgi:hypothetical protein